MWDHSDMKFSVLLLCALALSAAEHKTPNTMLMLEHYNALKDALIPGDIVFAFTARQPIQSQMEHPPEPDAQGRRSWTTVWNEPKFTRAIDALNAIHDSRVEKMVVLSSIEDLRSNLKRLPKDVGWIAYNMEPQMTPREELLDPTKAVIAFAKVCHDNGLKLSWVPGGFRMFASEERLRPIAPVVDAIVLQQQHELQNEGVDVFVKLTKERSALIGKLNPKCMVDVQVVIGRGSKEDLIKALQGVAGDVDRRVLWTMQDTGALREILKTMR